jgi:CheY-like chemotaxis protein
MSRRVLLVEDDTDLREIIADILGDAGYEVLEAAEGQQALDLLRSAEELPRVIFLDLLMPVLDGASFRVAQVADPRLARIPVVLMSAMTTGEQRARELEPDDYLAKPFDLRRVIELAERFCAPRPGEPGRRARASSQ